MSVASARRTGTALACRAGTADEDLWTAACETAARTHRLQAVVCTISLQDGWWQCGYAEVERSLAQPEQRGRTALPAVRCGREIKAATDSAHETAGGPGSPGQILCPLTLCPLLRFCCCCCSGCKSSSCCCARGCLLGAKGHCPGCPLSGLCAFGGHDAGSALLMQHVGVRTMSGSHAEVRLHPPGPPPVQAPLHYSTMCSTCS